MPRRRAAVCWRRRGLVSRCAQPEDALGGARRSRVGQARPDPCTAAAAASVRPGWLNQGTTSLALVAAHRLQHHGQRAQGGGIEVDIACRGGRSGQAIEPFGDVLSHRDRMMPCQQGATPGEEAPVQHLFALGKLMALAVRGGSNAKNPLTASSKWRKPAVRWAGSRLQLAVARPCGGGGSARAGQPVPGGGGSGRRSRGAVTRACEAASLEGCGDAWRALARGCDPVAAEDHKSLLVGG